MTWIGHATTQIDYGHFRVLTDPLLRRRVAHLRRRCELPSPSIAEADLVLLSHAHMDHLHVRSLRRIDPTTPVVAPRGTRPLLTRVGFERIIEVEPGDRVEVGPATIDTVDAAHPAGRGPHSKIRARPVGFVIEVAGHRTYFAGDTDLFDGMGSLGSIDVALLPIWGWGPSIGRGHLDPRRATEATALIRPRAVIPIHWGTYSPEDGRLIPPTWLDSPANSFVSEMRSAGYANRLQLLQPGQAFEVGPGVIGRAWKRSRGERGSLVVGSNPIIRE
ncbi:MAG: MBL fold metallo-hydrolase [Acidimicrobiia bacterium]|nr:MBL fold metallo-hydrolase [Acidimicrobiia bacterium]